MKGEHYLCNLIFEKGKEECTKKKIVNIAIARKETREQLMPKTNNLVRMPLNFIIIVAAA